MASVEALRGRLSESHVIIVTNDNDDGTDEVLDAYAERAPLVQILRIDGANKTHRHRVDRIAHARNTALDAVFDLVPRPAFTLVIDMDGPNETLPIKALLDCLNESDRDWAGLFANQADGYYDLYALRHPEWCPDDCWKHVRANMLNPRRLFDWWHFKKKFVYDRQYAIPTGHDWIEVHSAFGGLGLYRTASLENLRYGTRDADGRRICEHVDLHRQIREKGGRLFIAPSLLNAAPLEHLGPGSGRPFPPDITQKGA
ncbi:MAG: hypothetical protein HKO95_03130 [Rhodobacteraceae bacterium]|nr:hypothetical protein [Paracoccaceae bacterium]